MHWISAFGLVEMWCGDCHLNFWKGDSPDQKIRGPEKYGEICRKRSAKIKAFIKDAIVSVAISFMPIVLFHQFYPWEF